MDEALGKSAREPHIVAAGAAIIVVWKPPRMHCALLPSARGEPSLASWVFSRFPETAPAAFSTDAAASFNGGLVHRLDYETAGLVLFARHPKSLRALRHAQERDAIEKTYVLACSRGGEGGLVGSKPLRGCPEGLEQATWAACLKDGGKLAETIPGRSIGSMFRSYGPRGARVACLAAASANASGPRGGSVPHRDLRPRRGSPDRFYVTKLRSASLVGEGLGQEGLLATVGLTRGFRHQIRAHFAWIGLPLLGDRLYGGVERPFLALVATELGFEDPETGLPLRIRDDSIASPLSLT